jgi:hypothetical protein
MMSEIQSTKLTLALPASEMSQRERIIALRREWNRVKNTRNGPVRQFSSA